MATETSSYKSILRGMSIFGGVQVFQLLINLVRGKFVAILLGPAGSGVASLFTSASMTIQQLSSLGLPMSIAREVSTEKENQDRLEITIRTARRAIIFTALAGMLICSIGSWWLSDLTFGSHDYTWQFVVMSLAIGFTILWTGDQAVLQGLRRVKLLARATLVSSVVGLLAGVPLYWIWGVDGIVPAMVVLSLSVWLFYQYALHKTADGISRRGEIDWSIVRHMLSFGMLLMVGQLIGMIVVYLSNVYIRLVGSMSDLGCFQAATSICTQMVSLIFAAMAMDYFPRLTAAIKNNDEWHLVVNRQTELVVLLSAPLTILLMTTAPLVVSILLTDEYASVVILLHWMGAAVFLQSISYPMGYITFAHGNRPLYFWTEGIFANVVFLVSTCLCYKSWGITGLGCAALIRFAIDIVVYYAVNRKVYGFGYTRQCLSIVIENGLYIALAFVISITAGEMTTLACGLLLAIVVGWRSYIRIKCRLKSADQ